MFSVYKPSTALTELLASWNHADDRARTRIEAAMIGLEMLLQEDPHEQGESRADGTRVRFHYPLAIMYEIDEDNRVVHILRAWTYRRAAA